MAWELAQPCGTCGECVADPCPTCGGETTYTITVDYPGNWTVSARTSDFSGGADCGVQWVDETGSGLTTGVTLVSDWPYWNCQVDAADCLSLNFGADDFDTYCTITATSFVADSNTGYLEWLAGQGALSNTFSVAVDSEYEGNTVCCSCASTSCNILVSITDFEIANDPGYVIWEEFSTGDCDVDLCIYNAPAGTNNVTLEYTSTIDTDCCTNEPTGTVTGRTVTKNGNNEDGSQMTFTGPTAWNAKGYINDLSTALDAYDISAWGSFDLFFRMDEAFATNSFMGRYDVDVYGVNDDDSEVFQETLTAASHTCLDGTDCNSDHTYADEVSASGDLGQWTPTPIQGYKAFKFYTYAKCYDQVKSCPTSNPGSATTTGTIATATETVTVSASDPDFFVDGSADQYVDENGDSFVMF